MVQADASARMQPADILNLTVPNKSGVAVPLSTIATCFLGKRYGTKRPLQWLSLQWSFPVRLLMAYPSGQAMARLQQMVDDMGGGYSLEWGGQSREEAKRRLAIRRVVRIGRCR